MSDRKGLVAAILLMIIVIIGYFLLFYSASTGNTTLQWILTAPFMVFMALVMGALIYYLIKNKRL